jgi:hypothetical protein
MVHFPQIHREEKEEEEETRNKRKKSFSLYEEESDEAKYCEMVRRMKEGETPNKPS